MKKPFSPGMRSTRPRPKSRSARTGAMSLENSRFSTSVVTPIRNVSKRRQRLVALEHRERADIETEPIGVDDGLGERRDILEAEIEALAGNRMDAMRGIAGEREARRDEVAGQRQAEREGGAGLSDLVLRRACGRSAFEFVLEDEIVGGDQAVGVRGPLGPDQRRAVALAAAGSRRGRRAGNVPRRRPWCGRSCSTVVTMPDWP